MRSRRDLVIGNDVDVHELDRASVVVRWSRVDDAPLDDEALDDEARARCARLRIDDDRRRFVGARLLLRAAVAVEVGCDAHVVELWQRCERCGGPHGAPFVTIAGRAGPRVSLTHGGTIAAVAIASRPVGIDVEPVAGAADIQRWVRTEAALKATRHGLDVDHERVELAGTGQLRIVRWPGPGRRPVLRVRDARLAAGHACAVARLGRGRMRVDVEELALTSR